jgi:hypothetical protein
MGNVSASGVAMPAPPPECPMHNKDAAPPSIVEHGEEGKASTDAFRSAAAAAAAAAAAECPSAAGREAIVAAGEHGASDIDPRNMMPPPNQVLIQFTHFY